MGSDGIDSQIGNPKNTLLWLADYIKKRLKPDSGQKDVKFSIGIK